MNGTLRIFPEGRVFHVQYLNRQHTMDELELNYFLSRSLYGIGPSRAAGMVEQAKKANIFEKEVTFNLETMPIDYIRTQP